MSVEAVRAGGSRSIHFAESAGRVNGGAEDAGVGEAEVVALVAGEGCS